MPRCCVCRRGYLQRTWGCCSRRLSRRRREVRGRSLRASKLRSGGGRLCTITSIDQYPPSQKKREDKKKGKRVVGGTA
jgi:hypothetical protein